MKILHNRNLNELTPDTDLLGLSDKSKAIQFFIENMIDDNNIQMIALYGDWGSGKTSIMRDIEKNLNTKENLYHSVFFEVWKHEKDDNIALSLLNCLTNDTIKDKVVKETLDSAIDLFKSFGSSLSMNLNVMGAGIEFDAEKMMKNYKEFQKEKYTQSFLTIQKNFEKQIGLIEHKILSDKKIDTKKGKIIVFLDDLDRCEPHIVLDLLASIKLFYTYGKRLIFVCGIDKLAVQKAIEIKYQEIVKSEEYLEKIFDASFNVPAIQNFEKLLDFYFDETKIEDELVKEKLADFFHSIGFDRPRHIKKVLNKYAILVNYKNNPELPKNLKELIPNIIDENGNGIYYETYLAFYFIILSEFYPDTFIEVMDENRKLNSMANLNYINRKPNSNASFEDFIRGVKHTVFDKNFQDNTLNYIQKEILKIQRSNHTQPAQKEDIVNVFLTITLNQISGKSYAFRIPPGEYIQQFYAPKIKIVADFNAFILADLDNLTKQEWSEYLFKNYSKMIRTLL